MNKSFKVVFSKARSALMVVSEATSSVQAKGTKTVIAVAVAMVAGGAMAAQWVDAPTGDTVNSVTTTSTWDAVKAQNVFTTTGKLNFLDAADKKTFDKELWVKGSGTSANPMGLLAIGNGAEITNSGKIYITTEGDYWKANAFSAQNGATAINAGTIVAKSGVGMIVSSEAIGGTNTIINAANGQIYVEDNGQGMQLGGADNSKGVNQGLISAGKAAAGKETIGVQIETAGNTFTNEGTISAKDATHALLVKADASNSTINFEKTSKVEGLISVLGTATTINFNGAAGKYTIATTEQTTGTPAGEAKEAAKTGTTLNVKDGADVELVDGKKATYDALNVVNGKISASIWGNDNTFSNVTVEKDGVFNITKLNSRVDNKKIDLDKGVKGDRLLIARNQNITLKGGKLQAEGADFQGAVKIGASSQNGGTLTVVSGNYTLGDVQVYTNGALGVSGGSLTVNNLDLSVGFKDDGSVTGTAPKATVSAGTLNVKGKITASKSSADKDAVLNKLTVDGGELVTVSTNLFGKDSAGKTDWTKASGMVEGTKGTITVTDAQTMTLDQLKSVSKAYGTANVMFDDVTVDYGEATDKTIAFDEALGSTLINETATIKSATEGATTVEQAISANKTVGFAALALDPAVTTLKITGADGALILNGNTADGKVLATTGAVENFTVEGTLQLGKNAASKGTVNATNVSAKILNVNGTFDAQNVAISDNTTGSKIASGAALNVTSLTGIGAMNVEGALAANRVEAGVTLAKDSAFVIGDRLVNDKARASTLVNQIAGTVSTAASATGVVVTTNKDGEALLQAAAGTAYDATKNVGFYVDKTIGVDSTGSLTVGDGATAVTGGVAVGTNAVTVVNMAAFADGDTVFDAAGVDFKNAKVFFTGLDAEKTLTFTTGTAEVTGFTTADTNAMLAVTAPVAAAAGGYTVSVAYDKQFTEDATLTKVLPKILAANGNKADQKVLAAIGDQTTAAQYGFLAETAANSGIYQLTAKGEQATKEYLALPVTAGTYNVAYDAAEQVTGTIERRNTDALQGTGVWADVYYSSNAAKDMYGSQGYSADIFGGVIGVDYTARCGARMGAAFTIGTGDADSERSVSNFSNDADFYGLSVFAGKSVGDVVYIGADASYLWLDNDIKGTVAGASAAESIDSSVFTFGVRADWKAYAGDMVSVTPHLGVRYTNIDVDQYRGMTSGSMDVVEIPVGVKVAGNFESASGWKVKPAVDFTVVPQAGDKSVDTLVGNVDVIDNLYNTTLGVSAEYGNFTFGVNYRYGFGSNDRSNNSVNANVRYMF